MTQLYDQFNRPIPALKRPETREIAAVSIQDRWSSYPSAGLTPGRLAAILRQADWGDLRAQAELFEDIEEKDGHLASVMQTRRLAVLGLDGQVEDASDSAEDKKIAEFCREQLEALNLEGLWTHLLGAVGQGYAAAELLWENDRQSLIKGFNEIHPKNITFVNSLTPRVVTPDNWQGVDPPPFKLAFHRYYAKSGFPFRNGVLRVCAWMYLFKNFSLKDWAVFNEIFGMPLRLGKYESSATPADKEALRQAIANLGSDAAGIISKSTEIEFVEAAQRLSGTSNPYEALINYLDRIMSKAVLGQTLTTDTTGGTGTYAAGRVHEEVRRDLLEADAKALARTMREQVLRPLVGFNFGWEKPVPDYSLLVQDSPDLQADSVVIKNLADAGAGNCIPLRHINEHFGIPEPQDGEATLGAPRVPAAPPPGKGAALRAVFPLRDGGSLEILPQDRQVVQTHQELDNLVAAAMQGSSEAMSAMLAPVREMINAGGSLEEIRDSLLAVYGNINSRDLEELIYQASLLANLRGRLPQ
jgi:phage gp29-like protein